MAGASARVNGNSRLVRPASSVVKVSMVTSAMYVPVLF